jgi:hypothetical protein
MALAEMPSPYRPIFVQILAPCPPLHFMAEGEPRAKISSFQKVSSPEPFHGRGETKSKRSSLLKSVVA